MRSRQYRDLAADLARLLRSGVPLLESLESLAGARRGVDSKDPSAPGFGRASRAQVIGGLAAAARDGVPLSDALAQFPREVPASDIALVRAGETSGHVPEMLEGIVRRIDGWAELRGEIGMRGVWALVTAAAAIVLLPIAKAVSEGPGWYFAFEAAMWIPILGVVAVLWRGPRLFSQQSSLRESWQRLLLAIPWWGRLQAELAVARVFDVLGYLVAAGVTFREGLPLVAATTPWISLRGGLGCAAEGLERGLTVGEAFASLEHFLPGGEWRTRLVAGEAAGSVDRVLADLARDLSARFAAGVKRAVSVAPVVLILIVGVFVLKQALEVYGGFSRQLP